MNAQQQLIPLADEGNTVTMVKTHFRTAIDAADLTANQIVATAAGHVAATVDAQFLVDSMGRIGETLAH